MRFPINIGLLATIVIALMATIAHGVWADYSYRSARGHLPAALKIVNITYQNEEVWGFGPGGNETGVLVYSLDAKSWAAIDEHGLAFLETLTHTANHPRHPWPLLWEQTPIAQAHESWWRIPDPGNYPMGDAPRLMNYLARYGFWIPVNETVKEEINKTISRSGGFITETRVGYIIISPEIRRAYFVYSG